MGPRGLRRNAIARAVRADGNVSDDDVVIVSDADEIPNADAVAFGLERLDLPSVRSLGTELVDIASTPRAFADAVTRRALEGRAPGLTSARRVFAAQHSWAQRAQDFAEAVGLA